MTNKVVLYTIHCQKCTVLELKLKKLNIPFTIIDNEDEVVAYGIAHNIDGAPILEVDGIAYNFSGAINFLNTYNCK